MEYRNLGRTGLSVSLLSLGTLTMGPCQLDLSPSEGGALIREALSLGLTLIDTAEIYETYAHVREGLRGAGHGRPGEGGASAGRRRPLVMTKTYAHTEDQMMRSIDDALEDMGLDSLDVMLLHQQESAHTLRGHAPALKAMRKAQERGLVRAVGISTHHVAAVRAAAAHELDVVFALLNAHGLGIRDGSAAEMEEALEAACGQGMGIVIMKALGGGHLFREAAAALRYFCGKPWVHSVCVGMRSGAEMAMNAALLEGLPLPPGSAGDVQHASRRLVVGDCQGCGNCLDACRSGALRLEDDRVVIDDEKCILCSYCAGACPEFCLKVL